MLQIRFVRTHIDYSWLAPMHNNAGLRNAFAKAAQRPDSLTLCGWQSRCRDAFSGHWIRIGGCSRAANLTDQHIQHL